MIAQKGQPALRGLRVLGRSFHPAGNGGFRHVEAEHQEFAMDARRTPTWIVSHHLKDHLNAALHRRPLFFLAGWGTRELLFFRHCRKR
jgi:hypothetical protein